MQVASEYLKYYPNQGLLQPDAKLLIGEGGLPLYTTLVLIIIQFSIQLCVLECENDCKTESWKIHYLT